PETASPLTLITCLAGLDFLSQEFLWSFFPSFPGDVCPTPPPDTITICVVSCGSDWQCSGRQKCCNYGCLWHCMEPT
uniref:WAP domain-containing protein n=1 Tax=Naja naja TaxID=35670 RepID=A0A8C6XF25_NAJNA